MEQYEHQVPALNEPQRLSDYLVGVFPMLPSRKGTKKAIKKGHVFVNGIPGTTGKFIVGGENINYQPPQITDTRRLPDLKLIVHYEDDYLAVVEKPAGLLTSGNKWMTLANALPANLKRSKKADALAKPQPAHRLDYPTSGLLLVGNTATSLVQLNRLFVEKKVRKTYYAVSIGTLEEKGVIDLPIDGRDARTIFRRIARLDSARFGYLNLVELKPLTGRRHQLRIHLASVNCPILGDREYTP